MSLRAGLIGCGKIGSEFADDPLLAGDVYTHAEAYVRCAETELVAVCDSDAGRVNRCAERWGIDAVYTSPAELIAEARPDIVSICTPDPTHAEIACAAIASESVSALLCEKPLATRLEDGEALVCAARERGKVLAVAHVRRYAQNIRSVRELLASGQLGAVRAVSGWYGKGVLHNGSHWFDLLRMLAGEVEWIEAVDRLCEAGEDPSLDVALGLASGAVATLRAANCEAFTLFEMDLLTDRGRIAIRHGGHDIALYGAQPSRRYSGYTELVPVERDFGDMRNLMLHAVHDLTGALKTGRPPLCSGEDGLAALRIAEAARKAAATGRRIGVSPGLPVLCEGSAGPQ